MYKRQELGITNRNYENLRKNELTLEKTESMVYSCVDFRGKSLEVIGIETGLPREEVLTALLSLEPVSYTHLDVYKRQQEERAWRKSTGSGRNRLRKRYKSFAGMRSGDFTGKARLTGSSASMPRAGRF